MKNMKNYCTACLLGTSLKSASSYSTTFSGSTLFGRKTFSSAKGRKSSILYATLPSLPDRFGRWRFLQDLLDGDVKDDVVTGVLYNVLENYLMDPPVTASADGTQGSPALTPTLITQLETVLETFTESEIMALPGDTNETLLQNLEKLLPDPEEDEDAHKSAWDTVIEIHGRDMVKAKEMNPTEEWRRLCLVARLLVHYDFLSRDIYQSSQ